MAYLITTLIVALPLILVCVTGIIISLLRWSHHPSLSLLTSLGLGLLLFSRIVLGTLATWLPRYLIENGWAIEQTGLINGAVVFLANIVSAIGLSLLVYAVFAGRAKKNLPEL
jgi:hypothetical protein